jgi:hypothetical protein
MSTVYCLRFLNRGTLRRNGETSFWSELDIPIPPLDYFRRYSIYAVRLRPIKRF